MDNSLTGAIHFFDDEFHQYLNEGMSTLEFSVLRDHADVEYLVEGNYIQFTYKSRDYLMTIHRIEEDEWQLNISTEDLSFDLINEHAPAYTAPAARKITDYLKDILADSDVVIGLNEVSNYTRKLEWTGESTVLERVLSIMTKFDAECEFITELNNDRSLKQITLNIYHKYDDTHQGVGVNRSDIELRLGENVKTVQKTTDITELYTSIKPVGNDGLSIKNIEETITDDGGNVLYYTKKGSEYIFAPVANARFGRKNAEKGGYINMPYEFDTDSVATLYGNALSQLKKYSEPAVTYEVDGYYDLDIGDVVSIADNRYSPILLLEARAAEMIISFSNPENNKTIFSNYRVFDSQISSDLLKLMEQMKSDVDYAVQVANTPIFNITSKGSTAFKNGEGSVELTASIERANTDVTNEYTIFNWVKQNKDGSNDTEWTEAHKNQGKSITITPDDFVDTATFHYETEKDSKLYVGGSATVVKVYDGEDGKTPIKGVDYFDGEDGTNGLSAYLHIRYSQNSNGNPMTSDPTGAKYVGMQVSQNPNPSTVPADYDWTLVKGADGIPGETGADGKTSYLHIKYSNDGGNTFTSNSGEDVGSWIGQYVDFTQADSTDVKKYAWSKIKGEDGKDGIAGKDGVGLKSTVIQYAQSTSGTVAPTSGWTAQVPTLIKGQYLWTKTVWTYTDDSSETGYTVSYNAKDGNNGQDGIAGKDGVGIKSTKVEYASNTSGTTKPTAGWTTVIPSVPNGQFLWTRTTWTYDDNTTEQGFSVAKMGDTGPKGEQGDKGDKGDQGNQGIAGEKGEDGKTPYTHYAYAWSADGTDRFTDTYPNENLWVDKTRIPGFINVSGALITVTTNHQFVNSAYIDVIPNSKFIIQTWNPNKTKNTGSTARFAFYDKDKKYISGEPYHLQGFEYVKKEYTVPPDAVFCRFNVILAEVGDNPDPDVHWKFEFADKPTIYTPSPSDDFENAYPTYSGTYTDYTAQDSQNPADYTWTRILGESGQDGKDGVAGKDGVGIKTTTVTYALSDSGTTAPTSGWTATVPTLIKGKYLWTKSVWTYTDNSTETGYSVTYVAKDGNDGQDGLAGKDGVGIQSTAISYAKSDSGITAPTTGWTTTVPSVPEGQYLWTKTVWTYTDNTSETGYSVAKMGANGSDGTDGQDGVGIASTAITYQASASGTTAPTGTWSTTIPSVPAGQFLWTKTVTTYTNNTNSTAFTVAKMGSDGKPGSAGVSVSSVVEEYYVSTSPTSQAGGAWSTTVPNNADPNKYIWRRLKTTMSDSTVTYTNPALIQGMTGIYPYIGPTQPANPKEGQQWWKSDASGNVTNFYVYKSGSWQGQTIQQSVLNIIELNAVTITGSTITGTKINGGVISGAEMHSGLYTLTYKDAPLYIPGSEEKIYGNGTMIISLGTISDSCTAYEEGSTVPLYDTFMQLKHNKIVFFKNAPAPSYQRLKHVEIGYDGLYITNEEDFPGYNAARLTFQDLMTISETALSNSNSNWAVYATSGGSKPTALRRGRNVTLSGAFKPTKVLPSTGGDAQTTYEICVLPVGLRPERQMVFMAPGSGIRLFWLTVNPDGVVSASRNRNENGYNDFPAGGYYSIACSFPAGNI
ncbi:phage tail protein [Enterococcus sp.]|uniref:phage tail protein n=1 Tax=Enterococcus sp. TaxID=35783 RepID=UPI002FC5A55C